MSVGTSRGKAESLPFTVSYGGKADEADVLAGGFRIQEKAAELNGGGENMFFFGDNLDALKHLLARGFKGKIRLAYIDPPYATGSVFLSREHETAYRDDLIGAEYVEFLRRRLILIRELLAPDGSLYLHLDGRMAFVMKLVLDEVFGAEKFRSFIARRKCSVKNFTAKTYGNVSDYILFYGRTDNPVWHRPFEPWDEDEAVRNYPFADGSGRRCAKAPLHAPGVRSGETGRPWRSKIPPAGKHWQHPPAKLDELDAAGEIRWSPSGNPRRKVYFDLGKGIPAQDIWTRYRDYANQSRAGTGYPTEKNPGMLRMIVGASSNEGDWVLDCFAGSGSTLEAARALGRRWIGADSSSESLKAVAGHFAAEMPGARGQGTLDLGLDAGCGFTVWSGKEDKDAVPEILRGCCKIQFFRILRRLFFFFNLS